MIHSCESHGIRLPDDLRVAALHGGGVHYEVAEKAAVGVAELGEGVCDLWGSVNVAQMLRVHAHIARGIRSEACDDGFYAFCHTCHRLL
jgi:hypothetical protein